MSAVKLLLLQLFLGRHCVSAGMSDWKGPGYPQCCALSVGTYSHHLFHAAFWPCHIGMKARSQAMLASELRPKAGTFRKHVLEQAISCIIGVLYVCRSLEKWTCQYATGACNFG